MSPVRGPIVRVTVSVAKDRDRSADSRRAVRVDRLLQAQSDERLALLVRNGHDFAFEELVRRYRDPLTRYLRRLLGDPLVAEDALERGLIRAWASLLAGTSPIEFRQWIYGTVHAS